MAKEINGIDYQDLARMALQGLSLTREQCYAVLRSPEEMILSLLQAAFKVRERYFGKKVIIHFLINAKSGLCSEDCTYCSQSAISKGDIPQYLILDEEKILKGAYIARAAKAKRYCIVTSGRTPSKHDFKRIYRVVSRIKRETGIEICTSMGLVSEETARSLKEAGVDRYNHNLNTSERFYPQICTTHAYQDRIKTLQNARKAGLELCCGALLRNGGKRGRYH
jgi:biotin synthase